jgi:hypothetical protein
MWSSLGVWMPPFIASNGSLLLTRVISVAFITALVCVAIGLLGLQQLYAEVLAGKGQVGFAIAFVGLGIVSTTLVARILGFAQLYMPNYAQGAGLTMLSLGLIVIGGAALHHHQHKSWQLLPLVQGLLGLFLPVGAGIQGLAGFVAWIVFGLGWCWLGVIMVVERKIQLSPTAVAMTRR